MKKHLSGLSPALVISALALFIVLGGSSFAATSTKTTRLHYTRASLMNNWTYGGYSTLRPGYAKDSNGVVHLRGSVANGTAKDDAFILPPADRPSSYLYFTIYTYSGTQGSLEINPDGGVEAFGDGAVSFSSLDGITFSAK